MRTKIAAILLALSFLLTILAMPAAAAPVMTGTLIDGVLTVTVTGLSSNIAQVTFLAIDEDGKEESQMNTAVVSNKTPTYSFKVSGTRYLIKATPKNTSGVDQAPLTPIEVTAAGVTYRAHVQSIGWQKYFSDGATAGTTGKSLRIEALQINLTGSLPKDASITYQVHVQKKGWMNPVKDGAIAGTTGQKLRVESLKITLNGLPGYAIKYRVHQQTYGWSDWYITKNGTDIANAPAAGVTGKSKRLEAVEIKLVRVS